MSGIRSSIATALAAAVLASCAQGPSATGDDDTDVSANTRLVEIRIANGSDDAEETSGGQMLLDSTDLEMTWDRSHQTVGLRFANVAVARGAEIAGAWVQFTADEDGDAAADLFFGGEAAGHAAPFGAEPGNISSRPRTEAMVAWAPDPWTRNDRESAQRSPDLAAIVQEVVDREDWEEGHALALTISGTGLRTAEAYDGDPEGAATLMIEVAASEHEPEEPADPVASDVIETRIAAANDDMEEAEDGDVRPRSSDLELTFDGGHQTIGLRYPNLAIPQGATITSAWIQFTADESDDEATSLTIRAEAVDDASPFTDGAGNLSSRTLTAASTEWRPEPWTRNDSGPAQRTPDLAAVVQEVVDGAGWEPGNALAFLVTGTGLRTAEAYEGESHSAALLHVEYTSSGDGGGGGDDGDEGGDDGATVRVPEDHDTIQAAIDAAENGDTVLVAPGTYTENLVIGGKSVRVASHFRTTGDQSYIDSTVIDGGGGGYAFRVESTAESGTAIEGFTIRNAGDGVQAHARLHLLHNRITRTSDGVDYESGSGGVIRGNTFDDNSDDGIDLDDEVAVVIEDNVIRDNNDDGIEIRMDRYSGETLEVVIGRNELRHNGNTGIQLIGYGGETQREIRVVQNLFEGNGRAGLEMAYVDGEVPTAQPSVLEPVFVYNNTFMGGEYGMFGGEQVTARNNIVTGAGVGVSHVNDASTVTHTLFWNNGSDRQASNVDADTTIVADPLLNEDSRLSPGSPAIDAGVDVGLPYSGAAPDLGAFETGS